MNRRFFLAAIPAIAAGILAAPPPAYRNTTTLRIGTFDITPSGNVHLANPPRFWTGCSNFNQLGKQSREDHAKTCSTCLSVWVN